MKDIVVDLTEKVEKKFKKTGASPLMFSQSWIYKVLTEKLSYKKLCAGWVLKMVTDPHEKKKIFHCKIFNHPLYKPQSNYFLHLKI